VQFAGRAQRSAAHKIGAAHRSGAAARSPGRVPECGINPYVIEKYN